MAQYEDEFPARVRVSGHLRTLIQSIGHLPLKVWRCPTLSCQPICIKYQDENCQGIVIPPSSLICMSAHKASAARCHLEHQA